MNGRRTLAIAKKVLRSLKHDPRSIALMLVGPILAMSIFGFAFGSDIQNVPLAVVNDDGPSGAAATFIGNLDRDALDVREYASMADAERDLTDARVKGILHFPAGFSASIRSGNATAQLALDGSNSQYVAHIVRHFQLALQESMPSGVRAPVTLDTDFVYAEGARYIDFFVPGIMAFAVMMLTTLLTLLAFVGERTSGTLTRLLATPVRGTEIVFGYAIAFGAVACVQGLVLLTVALLLFDAMVAGSLALAFLVVILVAIDAMSLGILLSAAAKRELQAVQMIPLVIFPTFLLSGIFVPVDTLPAWLKPFSWAIPPTYAVEALRDIMLRGWGFDRVWPYLAGLVGFGALFLGLASWRIEKQRAPAHKRRPPGEPSPRQQKKIDDATA